MPQKTPVFADLDQAKAFAAEQTAANPRARTVYKLEFAGKDGSLKEVYLVAQSVPRAQNHAFGVLRDEFEVKLGVAERKAGGFRQKTPEEMVRSLSPEEIERVKGILAEMSGGEKPARRKKGEQSA